MKPWILGLALVMGCGSTSSGTEETVGSTTEEPTTAASSTSTSGTTDVEEGSTGPATSGSSTSATDTDTDTEPPNLDPGPVECERTSCGASCGHAEYQLEDDGDVCECASADEPEGLIPCRLPLPCESSGEPGRCVAQALRYNISGAYELEVGDPDDPATTRYEVFGPGLVRSSTRSLIHGCCTGSASTSSSYLFPQSTAPADDPFWDRCEAEPFGVSSCFNHEILFPGLNCQPMLDACPELVELGDTCEESCPMAGDGICDEEAGTGLCDPGCDPDDCA